MGKKKMHFSFKRPELNLLLLLSSVNILSLLLITLNSDVLVSFDLYFSNKDVDLNPFLLQLTAPAEEIGNIQNVIIYISLLLLIDLFLTRSFFTLISGLLCTFLVILAVFSLKVLTARLGPTNSQGYFFDESIQALQGVFPSGHLSLVTLAALLSFLTLAKLVNFKLLIIPCLLIVAYEGFSLWYHSHHWLSDILFGFTLSIFLVMLTRTITSKLEKIEKIN
jgi:membrane-associated phospholipid phosphatase